MAQTAYEILDAAVGKAMDGSNGRQMVTPELFSDLLSECERALRAMKREAETQETFRPYAGTDTVADVLWSEVQRGRQ